MTQFVFTELVDMADAYSAALGTGPANKFTDIDRGKPVKLGTNNNYVLCADGDEVEGYVAAVADYTVNNLFSFGTVVTKGRKYAEVIGAALVVGDLVVAGANPAVGTGLAGVVANGATATMDVKGKPIVKKGAPTRFVWRVIRIVSGTGVAGDTVLIERVNA